jgi:hypothetical protein
MSGGRNLNPHDPTAERTADQSTQTAGGLHQPQKTHKPQKTHRRHTEDLGDARPGQGPEVAQESDVEDVLNRNDKDLYETPRRYEEDEASTVEGATPKNHT